MPKGNKGEGKKKKTKVKVGYGVLRSLPSIDDNIMNW